MTFREKYNKQLKIASHTCRLVMGILFIFSGVVKSVDPWGTYLKVNEYLSIYGMEVLLPISMIFSIWLCGVEIMMGLMLTFRVRTRFVSIFAFFSMIFFTLLTFLSATWLPVEDCGCFGDALKLSPWATFAKNAVFLPMAFTMWYYHRPEKIFAFSKREVCMTFMFFFIGMGVGTYCYLHLPLIDFLPYKVGVNIGEEMRRSAEVRSVESAVVVCRHKRSGKIREFDINDREWQNDVWEWVDTRTVSDDGDVTIAPLISEFSVRDVKGDVTGKITGCEGRLYLICVTRLHDVGKRCEKRLGRLVERAAAEGAKVVCLTPEYLESVTYRRFDNTEPVRCYNIDATVMKTMLRASNGVVVLDDGTITDKRNCRDID